MNPFSFSPLWKADEPSLAHLMSPHGRQGTPRFARRAVFFLDWLSSGTLFFSRCDWLILAPDAVIASLWLLSSRRLASSRCVFLIEPEAQPGAGRMLCELPEARNALLSFLGAEAPDVALAPADFASWIARRAALRSQTSGGSFALCPPEKTLALSNRSFIDSSFLDFYFLGDQERSELPSPGADAFSQPAVSRAFGELLASGTPFSFPRNASSPPRLLAQNCLLLKFPQHPFLRFRSSAQGALRLAFPGSLGRVCAAASARHHAPSAEALAKSALESLFEISRFDANPQALAVPELEAGDMPPIESTG